MLQSNDRIDGKEGGEEAGAEEEGMGGQVVFPPSPLELSEEYASNRVKSGTRYCRETPNHT